MDSKSLSHTRWKCQYHIVFIPKYRKKVLYGECRAEIRDIIKRLLEMYKLELVEGAVCIDHIAALMLLSVSEHPVFSNLF